MVPARLTLTSTRSVPVRSLTVIVSVPPRALRSIASTSLRSITMLPRLRVNSTRPPLAEASKISFAGAAVEQHACRCRPGPRRCRCRRPGPTGTRRCRRPGRPTSLPCWPSMKSLPSPPSSRSTPLLPRMVSLPAPPSTVIWIRAARLPVAENESSPPLALTTRFSAGADVDGRTGRGRRGRTGRGCRWR